MKNLKIAIYITLILIPSLSKAESLYILETYIHHKDDIVGILSQISEPQLTWSNETSASLKFENKDIKFQVPIDLAKECHSCKTELHVGVGEETKVNSTSGWSITMLPETWSTILRRHSTGYQIAIPDAFPVKVGFIDIASKNAKGKWPKKLEQEYSSHHSGFDPELNKKLIQSLCLKEKIPIEPSQIFLKPDLNSPSFTSAWVNVCATSPIRKGFAKVVMYNNGFILKGFAKSLPSRAFVTIPSGLAAVTGDGTRFKPSRVAFMPNTNLFFPGSKKPFATIKTRLTGLLMKRKGCSIYDQKILKDQYRIELKDKSEHGPRITLNFEVDNPKNVISVEPPNPCSMIEGTGSSYMTY